MGKTKEVGAVKGHGVKGVTDGGNTHGQGNVLAAQSIGIALAVKALVMTLDNGQVPLGGCRTPEYD